MQRRAFTLIERLVVIAIIAILAAILFPVFAQAKTAAKKTNDLSQLKQHGLSTMMYIGDYDDKFPAIPAAGGWTGMAANSMGPHWADRLFPYVKNKGIFSDPSNTRQLYFDQGYWKPGQRSATDTSTANLYRVGYSLNQMLTHSDVDPRTPRSASQTAIPQMADTVLMGPSLNWYSWGSCQVTNGVADLYWNVSRDGAFWGYEFWGGNKEGAGYAGGTNFAYADGSARYAKLVIRGDNGRNPDDLYAAYFRAKIRPEFSTTGVCTGDRSSVTVGY